MNMHVKIQSCIDDEWIMCHFPLFMLIFIVVQLYIRLEAPRERERKRARVCGTVSTVHSLYHDSWKKRPLAPCFPANLHSCHLLLCLLSLPTDCFNFWTWVNFKKVLQWEKIATDRLKLIAGYKTPVLGSVMGPLLFLLYIKYLPLSTPSSSTRLFGFAGDGLIFRPIIHKLMASHQTLNNKLTWNRLTQEESNANSH